MRANAARAGSHSGMPVNGREPLRAVAPRTPERGLDCEALAPRTPALAGFAALAFAAGVEAAATVAGAAAGVLAAGAAGVALGFFVAGVVVCVEPQVVFFATSEPQLGGRHVCVEPHDGVDDSLRPQPVDEYPFTAWTSL